MSEPSKLDWWPLYTSRLKASPAWTMEKVFDEHRRTMPKQPAARSELFGWFITLLVEESDLLRPWYLPNDMSRLWALAGANSESFFCERGGRALLTCHFTCTEDGLWRYNEALVRVLAEQERKRRVGTPPSLSLSPGFYVGGVLNQGSGAPKIGDGESDYARFRAAHPRSTGSQAEQVAFMEACGGASGSPAEEIITAAKLYREASEAGTLGHSPARADNWLRDRVFNEDPAIWQKGAPENGRSARNRKALQEAFPGVAEGKD